MRRAELEVGALLFHRSGTWGSGGAVRVLSTEPHETNRYQGTHRQVSGGHGVLVQRMFQHPDGWREGRQQVVPLGQLRGPWEQLRAEEVAEAERKQAEREARDEARDETNANLRRLVTELNALTGLDLKAQSWDQDITLSVDQLARIVASMGGGA